MTASKKGQKAKSPSIGSIALETPPDSRIVTLERELARWKNTASALLQLRNTETASLAASRTSLYTCGAHGTAGQLFGVGFEPKDLFHTTIAPEAVMHIRFTQLPPDGLNLSLGVSSNNTPLIEFIWNGHTLGKGTIKNQLQRVDFSVHADLVKVDNVLLIRLLHKDGITLAQNSALQMYHLMLEPHKSPKEIGLESFIRHNHRLPDTDNLPYFNDVIYKRKMDLWDTDLSMYVDKLAVRDVVRKTVGENYLLPVQKVYDRAEAIQLEELKYPCCLKANHANGQILFLDSKDVELPIQKINNWLKVDYFRVGGEPGYRGITPKLYVEDKLNPNNEPFDEMKFHCFGGKVRSIQVDWSRFGDTTSVHYDCKWNKQLFCIGYYLHEGDMGRPENLDEMIFVAEKLSAKFKTVRVDMYRCNGKIYIGEITFFHYNAMMKNTSVRWDRWLVEQYKSVQHFAELI